MSVQGPATTTKLTIWSTTIERMVVVTQGEEQPTNIFPNFPRTHPSIQKKNEIKSKLNYSITKLTAKWSPTSYNIWNAKSYISFIFSWLEVRFRFRILPSVNNKNCLSSCKVFQGTNRMIIKLSTYVVNW